MKLMCQFESDKIWNVTDYLVERKMGRHSVCIILPTLNEELTIGKVIDEIPRQALEKEGYQVYVLVVDGNSSDRTRQIAQENGAAVIIQPRRGKGRQVRMALRVIKADFVFMLDSDYTYPASYIPDMLKILRQGYPVVIGSRLKGQREKGAIRPLNVVGNILLTLMANILYRSRISDVCTGYWGMRGEVIPNLNLSADGFQLEAELFTQLAKQGYPIVEVPIYYRRREAETKLSRIKDGIKIGWMLMSRRFQR